MNFPYQSAFAEALGWSLIDSLWQMGATWLFYIMITGNGKRFTSQKRHSLALFGTAIGMLLFIVSLVLNYFTPTPKAGSFSLSYLIDVVPFISFLYVPAVVFFALRMVVQVSINNNVYRKNLVEANCNISAFVSEMCERIGIMKKVSIWMSERVESPLTIGYLKPAIFLPVAVFTHLSCRQVEAVIMHELHHIKNNDYIINIFLAVADIIMFFNPFARMMFASVKKERENSCDDFVIASGFDAWEYSQALYILGRYRNEKSNLAIAATGEGKEYLLQRIRRMMKTNNQSPSVLKPLLAFFLCLFAAAFGVRHKQIIASPTVSLETRTVPVVYFEEKHIIITPPEKRNLSEKATSQRKKKAATINKTNTLIHPVPEYLATDEPIGIFVAAPRVIEFTIIDPVKPVVPEIVCESPQPYIQKSSFYFTEVDTAAGKKVIDL